MKTIFLSLSLLLSTLLLSNELSWVDEQVQAIKPPRSGMSSKLLASLHSPFIFLKKNRDEESTTNVKKETQKVSIRSNTNVPQLKPTFSKVLSLGAIMNNSVMINGKWHKIGDTINGYKVKEMNYNSVLLIKHNKRLLLSTKSRSKTIKFQK